MKTFYNREDNQVATLAVFNAGWIRPSPGSSRFYLVVCIFCAIK